MFFVFDGIDGSGKSTQLALFTDWLRSDGHSVVSFKDPGSTELGERLRDILLATSEIPIHAWTEVLMFTTARTQLVHEQIRPALNSGKIVVLDRYIFSTVVYQGFAGHLNTDDIWTINRLATEGLLPDLTFLFDLPAEIALQRMLARPGISLDRMESRGIEYFRQVRSGFLQEAERWPAQTCLIDARQPVEEIQVKIQTAAAAAIAIGN